MSDQRINPSQLAANNLLARVEEDGNIPEAIKNSLAGVIMSGDPAQIETLRSSLSEWAAEDESQKHPSE